MLYTILCLCALTTTLHTADSFALMNAVKNETLGGKLTITSFYNAVRTNDAESIKQHLLTEKFYPLNNLAKEALRKQHKNALFLLLDAGARPPLYQAAEQGRIDLALITLKHFHNTQSHLLTQREKEKILTRLVKTGNKKLLHMFFNFGIIRPEDVSHSIVQSAQNNTHIHAVLVEKQFMHGNGSCAICITPFCHEEIHNPELLLKCGHMFHTECSAAWFEKRPTCPLCQKTVRPKKK